MFKINLLTNLFRRANILTLTLDFNRPTLYLLKKTSKFVIKHKLNNFCRYDPLGYFFGSHSLRSHPTCCCSMLNFHLSPRKKQIRHFSFFDLLNSFTPFSLSLSLSLSLSTFVFLSWRLSSLLLLRNLVIYIYQTVW